MSRSSIEHRFVEFIPELLDDGVLYISIPYKTASHQCCCGCGQRVVTKLAPEDWRVIFDGRTVSLWPSIGNWSFECQSHYWIRRNEIDWSRKWSNIEIERVRQRTRQGHQGANVDPYDFDSGKANGERGNVENTETSLRHRVRRFLRL